MSRFDGIRKKMRRRRIEAMLLAGYAFAVTCALFISLITKNSETKTSLPLQHSVSENYDFNADVLTPAFSDSANDNPFEMAYLKVNSVKLLSENEAIVQKFELKQNEQKTVLMPVAAKPQRKQVEFSGLYQKERHVVIVESGDTFNGILTKLGMDNKTANDAYNVLKKVYDARRLRAGQHIQLTATFDVQTRALEALDTLIIEPERGTKYILRVNEYDKFEAKVEQEKFERDVRVVEGSVAGLPSASMIKAGVPRRIAMEIISRMSHMINFRTDVHKGDTFKVKFEVSKAADGYVAKLGQLLYASFSLKQRTYKIYRYNDNFYNDKGETKKTGLDIKPLAMRNARISSLYGYRRHPIYKTQKFHSGVDYAAPKGTAIYASGNGVVEIARYVNGYGNFVKLRHNSEYETAYGHMQRFASGIRPGVRVRKGQIIGYVGSTGRSTGPHLHFEIIRKGQRINPLKAQVATGNDLTGRQLADFKSRMRQIDAMQEKIKKVEKKATLSKISQNNNESTKKPLDKDKQKVADGIKNVVAVNKAIKQEISSLDKASVVPDLDTSSLSATVRQSAVEEQQLPKSDIKQAKETETENKKEIKEEKEDEIQSTVSETKEITTDEITSDVPGKIMYPPKISATVARTKYSPAAKKGKRIKIPIRKPKYARR